MCRPLGKLLASSDILSGEEAETMRDYCAFATANIDNNDLTGPYGVLFIDGNLAAFREHFEGRVQHFEDRQHEAAQELFKLRWGPTRIPVYVVLLFLTRVQPDRRYKYISIALWLIQTAKIPGDRGDISGTTALMHSISTKPHFDPEFAQIMLDAGANINRRDRFGSVVGLDITTVQLVHDYEAHEKAGYALQWFLEHGGDIDIKDGEDVSARDVIKKLERTERTLKKVLEAFERRKKEGKIPDSSTLPRPTGRNSPCPCGSGHKFKKCCGSVDIDGATQPYERTE